MSKKDDEVVLKTAEYPDKTMEVSVESDFMDRATQAQKEIAPILEKYDVTILCQLDYAVAGLTGVPKFADIKKSK